MSIDYFLDIVVFVFDIEFLSLLFYIDELLLFLGDGKHVGVIKVNLYKGFVGSTIGFRFVVQFVEIRVGCCDVIHSWR